MEVGSTTVQQWTTTESFDFVGTCSVAAMDQYHTGNGNVLAIHVNSTRMDLFRSSLESLP